MKKRAILLILGLFLISACTLPFFGQTQPSAGEGLKIEFTTFPSTLYENTPFQVGVKITNFVKSDVKGYLCITDYGDPASYGGITEGQCTNAFIPSAYDVSAGTLESEEIEYSFPLTGGAFEYINLDKDFKTDVTVAAIFNYDVITTAQTNICVRNPLLSSSIKEIPCEIKEKISSISQPDMPIEVAQIDKNIMGTADNQAKLVLAIFLKKVQDGYIIDYKNLEAGMPSKDSAIDVDIRFGKEKMLCKPLDQGKLKFMNKDERVLTCELNIPLHQEFLQQPLFINLHYGYQMLINGNVQVAKEVN